MRVSPLLVLAAFLVACSSPSNVGTVRVEDRPLPELSGTGLHGEQLSSTDARGHVLVISVWATWCLPCERDQPGFVNVANSYRKDGVRFLGLDAEENGTAQSSEWVRRYGVPYPSIMDPSGRFAASLGYMGLPATYVVDPSGTIRYSVIGSTTSEATLSGLIDQVLSGASPATSPG